MRGSSAREDKAVSHVRDAVRNRKSENDGNKNDVDVIDSDHLEWRHSDDHADKRQTKYYLFLYFLFKNILIR